jgi:hypothetical protein
VLITPGGNLRLALEAPLSSESAVTGDALSAETTSPVRIEGLEAVPTGSRLTGRVTHASSAAQSAGRGEMTLEFDTLELPGGVSESVRARPLGLRAPASRKKDNALITGLSDVGLQWAADRGPQRVQRERSWRHCGAWSRRPRAAMRGRTGPALRSCSAGHRRRRSSRSGAREVILSDVVLRAGAALVSALEPPVLVRGGSGSSGARGFGDRRRPARP